MPQLFDVPGWSVPEPSKGGLRSDRGTKKRKRPTSDTSSKLLSAEFNLEKLMEKLKESTKPHNESNAATSSKAEQHEAKKTKKQKKGKGKPAEGPRISLEISLPKPLQSTGKVAKGKAKEEKAKVIQESPPRPAKRVKVNHVVDDPPRSQPAADKKLTALQKSMRKSLEGAKFRMINEDLYKSDSHAALRMVHEDPAVYSEYHIGFRHQVQSWPTNPVEQYISKLEQYPPRTVIADLGCGDAALARGLLPLGMAVLSYDLISDGAYVVEADVCSRIPLPGSEPKESESSSGEGQVVDVAVFSLSLMSTNWPACIREAWRIMKPDGELQVAEVASRFTNVKEFENLVCSMGFRLKAKDDRNSYFTLFEFEKTARKAHSEKEWGKILGKATLLKPCEYKRR